MSSTYAGFTSFQPFHTPTSISDGYEQHHSAQSSSLSLSLASARLRPSRHPTIPDRIICCRRRRCQPQRSIVPTITPARYSNNLCTLSQIKPSHPLRGPKVFFTSAKGAGVSEVFAYVAHRVVMRREWEEVHPSGPRSWKWQHCSSCSSYDWEAERFLPVLYGVPHETIHMNRPAIAGNKYLCTLHLDTPPLLTRLGCTNAPTLRHPPFHQEPRKLQLREFLEFSHHHQSVRECYPTAWDDC